MNIFLKSSTHFPNSQISHGSPRCLASYEVPFLQNMMLITGLVPLKALYCGC